MHTITIASARPGQFSAYVGDRLLVTSSRTPFFDGARILLAAGLAEPDDIVIMVYAANPSTECLRAKVGVAAIRAPRAARVGGEPTRNPQAPLKEMTDRRHDTLSGPRAAHENVAIVSVTNKPMIPPLQFPVQLMEHGKCLEALEQRSAMNITDLARYGEGVLTEAEVRRKYRRFDDDIWEKLGSDDALVHAIEAERTRRVRSGACVREKAQLLHTKAPEVLGDHE
jgi:hypothetical protein